MKNYFFAATLFLFGLLPLTAATNAESTAPQKLSDAEMAEMVGGLTITITCDVWYICGTDLCGEGCDVSINPN